ncbi:MAG: DUF4476 domain-containing protein [Flavobacteriales bacterium]|nr:DUF4476 domain-containing protein [Flavobacteriales bacterium]MBK6945616.1 DUF4476 domain-containing protein [Flavobacteriales bacterium]MBK7296275.1 DUF4476 domain-containing protein [Flavobacteriales bacterium]MBK9534832.1 DUF4476 domain-containing protein [Flavobacteriales bacterium]MBP9137696.1 DUF4476 domain-containing protein [Flavobacteriales bacterium]
MIRSATLFLTTLLTASCLAQTTDLVFFTDDGSKFTLTVDGDVKNAQAASRVVATGIRTETPVIMINFEDAAQPAFKKSGYFTLGKEYTLMITNNKKGERVLRMTGEAGLGTAAKLPSPDPSNFVEDGPNGVVNEGRTIENGSQQITTTVIEGSSSDGTGENVRIDMGVNGVDFNMNVGVTEGSGSSTTTQTTTMTTTTTTVTNSNTATPSYPVEPVSPVPEPPIYHMPGYTGPIGCGWPMSPTEYADAKTSIESKSFEETKMTTAKQVGRDRCFTAEQVKGIMNTFSFEDTKLEFAKYAYERTYDIGNYYKLNDAFSFESSIEELNEYTQGR